MATDDVFHKAARDGYLDLLREATRKECNKLDEDGMTPTMWAAYCGNLDALRMLVGRGGNPDKSDYHGNTALHHAAANGMLNCVTFLVSFGSNLWSMDNNFQTALDLAAVTNRDEIVKYLDTVYTKQSHLNPKLVRKWKEKAQLDAHKRAKKMHKIHERASKKAEKEDNKIIKSKERRMYNGYGVPPMPPTRSISAPNNMTGTMRSTKSLPAWSNKSPATLSRKHFNEPKPYSEHFTLTSQNRKAFIGGTARKTKQRKEQNFSIEGDFVVREVNDGKKTVRSLAGLRRDTQILYMGPGSHPINGSISSLDSGLSPGTEDEGPAYPRSPVSRRTHPDAVSRALSEPAFYHNGDSGVDLTSSSQDLQDTASIFERPGFGSVAFMKRPMQTLSQLSSEDPMKPEAHVQTDTGQTVVAQVHPRRSPDHPVLARKQRAMQRLSKKSFDDSLSIGTIGSLAVRIKDLSMQEEPMLLEEDDIEEVNGEGQEQNQLEFFLAVNGLSEYFALFMREEIDFENVMFLTDGDLEKIGMRLGPRRKLLEAITRRKAVLEKPGQLTETWL